MIVVPFGAHMMDKKVFQNFEEFVSLTRPLTVDQRKKLVEYLPKSEKQALLETWQSQGWEDLFIRNEIDQVVDFIRTRFNEDIISLRIQVKSGNICKVKRSFWDSVLVMFEPYSDEQKRYVLEGIETEDLGQEWVLLVPSKRR
tara:strand:- start:32365 stop:32793 length:429 start_codon:yes stop_codon:yes gene_type:complete